MARSVGLVSVCHRMCQIDWQKGLVFACGKNRFISVCDRLHQWTGNVGFTTPKSFHAVVVLSYHDDYAFYAVGFSNHTLPAKA